MNKINKTIGSIMLVVLLLTLVIIKKDVKANDNLGRELKHDLITSTISSYDSDNSIAVGSKKPVYFNVIVLAEYNQLSDSKLKIYLPLKDFGVILKEDLSNAVGINNITIENDGLNNVITYELAPIFGGSSISIPVNITLQAGAVADKEILNIQSQLFDKDGNMLTSTQNDVIYGSTSLDVLFAGMNTYLRIPGVNFKIVDGKETIKAGSKATLNYNIATTSNDSRNRILRLKPISLAKLTLDDGWLYNDVTNEYYKIIDNYDTKVSINIEYLNDTTNFSLPLDFKINYADSNNNIDYSIENSGTANVIVSNMDEIKFAITSGVSFKSKNENVVNSTLYFNDYDRDFLLNNDYYLNTNILRNDDSAITFEINKLESMYSKPSLIKGVMVYSNYDSKSNAIIYKNKVYGINLVNGEKVKTLIASNVSSYVAIDEQYFDGIIIEFESNVSIIKSNSLMIKAHTKIEEEILNTYFEQCLLVGNNTACILNQVTGQSVYNIVGTGYNTKEYYVGTPGNISMQNEYSTFQLKNTKIVGNTFINEQFKYNYTFSAFNATNKLIDDSFPDNLYSYILLPVGTKFNGLNNLKSGEYTFNSELNYKNTNQTLITIKYPDTKTMDLPGLYDFEFDLENTLSNLADKNSIKHHLSWDNNYKYGVNKGRFTTGVNYYSTTVDDVLDFSLTNDKIELVNTDFYFAPPLELFFQNSGKIDDNGTFVNGTFESEIGGNLNYKLSINNNSLYDINNLTIIDVLPHKDDLSIIPNSEGSYINRGSEYNVRLSGKVKDVPGYTTYYTTDDVKGSVEENANATWVTESPLRNASFYNNVTMVKFVMNNDYVLTSKNVDEIILDVMVEDDEQLTEGLVSYNTYIGYLNNNLNSAIESQSVATKLFRYDINGCIYFDKDQDSTKSLNDIELKNIELNVKLVDSNGLVISDLGNIYSDVNGNFTYSNAIKGGQYIFSVVDDKINKYSSVNVSNENLIGNDIDSLGETTFNLDTDTRSKVINVAVNFDQVKVTTEFIDVDGDVIDSEDVKYYDIFDTFSTNAKTINNYTMIEGPTNPGGTINISDTEIIKTYKYLRNDASNVVVQHVDELGNTLISPTILDGTSKIGLAYTTSEASIENYLLIETPTNKDGFYSDSLINVIYVYEREDALDIVINYLDENNNIINEQKVYDGSNKLGLIETIEIIDIKGYTYFNNDFILRNVLAVTYTKNAITINMYYEKNVSADVIVSYVDVNNNEISDSIILKGSKVDNLPYVTNAKVIKGYTLKSLPTNAKGYFGEKEIKVVYIYEKDTKIVQTGSVLARNAIIMVLVGTSLISCLVIKRKYID